MAKSDKTTSQKSADERQRDAEKAREQEPAQTVIEQHPELDPNEPGIDEVERNRRREELTRLQG
jgi:hypothetical protein